MNINFFKNTIRFFDIENTIRMAEQAFDNIFNPQNDNIAIGVEAQPPEKAKNCIAVGYGATTPDVSYSVTLASGPNQFVRPDSNINIAHVMEGNSETKDVLFPGAITSQEGFYIKENLEISEIDICDACGNLELPTPGFNWDANGALGSLCLNCIRDTAMQYKATQHWNNKNGDPITNLRNEIKLMFEIQKKQLQDQIDSLKNDLKRQTNF